MAFNFPSSPTNNQVYTFNSISYVYNSTLGVWRKVGEIGNVDWSEIINKPDPVITLNSGVSGSATMTDLTSVTINATVVDTGVVALKAPLASPTFTGIPAAPTAAVDTNTTQIATTAFVIGQASSTNPSALGSVAAGTSTRYARADHVHPTTGLGLTSGTLAQFAATTSSQLAGVISDETGSGALVFSTSPSLTTPNIGSATASYLTVTAQDGTNEGGEIRLNGAGSNSIAILDNYIGRLRFHDGTNVRFDISATSATFSGTLISPAATTSISSIRLPHGTAPTAPTNGDMWTTTAGVYARINGSTVGPLGAGGGIDAFFLGGM